MIGKRRILIEGIDPPVKPAAVAVEEPPPPPQFPEWMVRTGDPVEGMPDEVIYVVRNGLAHPIARLISRSVESDTIDVTSFNDLKPQFLKGLTTVRYEAIAHEGVDL